MSQTGGLENFSKTTFNNFRRTQRETLSAMFLGKLFIFEFVFSHGSLGFVSST